MLPGLTLNTQFVYEVESQNASWHATEQSHLSRTIRNAYTIYDDNGKIQYLTPRSGGMLRTTQTDGNYWTARAQANYSRTFLEKHDIAAIAGLEFRQTKLNGTKSLVLGYDEQLQSSATQTVDFNVLANDWRDNYFYMTNFGYGFPSASVALPYIYDGMGVEYVLSHIPMMSVTMCSDHTVRTMPTCMVSTPASVVSHCGRWVPDGISIAKAS